MANIRWLLKALHFNWSSGFFKIHSSIPVTTVLYAYMYTSMSLCINLYGSVLPGKESTKLSLNQIGSFKDASICKNDTTKWLEAGFKYEELQLTSK